MHKFKQAFYTPKSCILAQSHAHLTVGEANLTVTMGCSHCKQCQEVERSVRTYCDKCWAMWAWYHILTQVKQDIAMP